MASASAIFGGAGGDFTIPADASYATGSGWLIDPALNTGGVLIYTLVGNANSLTTEGYIGSDTVTPTNNKRVWGKADGATSLSKIKLEAGLGLYTTFSGNNVLFKYL